MNVVLAADTNFAKQLAVAVAGLARSSDGSLHRVYVLHSGYTSELKADVERATDNRLEFHWLETSVSDEHADALIDYLATATLFRLRMEDLLPADVHRVIYLDADVIVRAPLAALWEADLGSSLAGGVRDAIVPWSGSALEWRRLGVPPQRPYFNAGVMVVPLDRWREERVSARALEFLLGGGLNYGDQCALNLAIAGRWTPLDPMWNLQSWHLAGDTCPAWVVEQQGVLERALEDPAVVHFTHSNRQRPWEAWPAHQYRDEWYALLDVTPWSGWRPVSRHPSKLSRAVGRARRTGQVLFHGRY